MATFQELTTRSNAWIEESLTKVFDEALKDQKNPTFFYHIVGQEEFSASGTSYLNRAEAGFIEKSSG